MPKIYIVNKRHYCGQGVYIGRPSPLGNPFTIGTDGTREEVIAKYETWLKEQWVRGERAHYELKRLIKMYLAGQDITLICWCAPLPCHGDVIKAAIIRISERIKENGNG